MWAIRRSISTSTEVQLINSFIISRIDYFNSLLAGLPAYQLDRVQSILNFAIRLIYERAKYDHVTPILRDKLHWLRVSQRSNKRLVLETSSSIKSVYDRNNCLWIKDMPKSTQVRGRESPHRNCYNKTIRECTWTSRGIWLWTKS